MKNDNELPSASKIKWEFFKNQICKFSLKFSKICARKERKQRQELETTLRIQ